MAISLQHAGELTVELANQLLGQALGEAITEVRVTPLGEGVGLMSSIGRAALTLASGKETSVVVKVIAQTENVSISKQLNFYANEISIATCRPSVRSEVRSVILLILIPRRRIFC
jgi:hypothetical protein